MLKIGKRVLTILLLVTMLLAIIPVNVNAAISVPTLDVYAGVFDDEVEVEGDGVTAGATVNIYWDSVKSWDGAKGLLGSTTAKSSGEYDFEFDIPESTNVIVNLANPPSAVDIFGNSPGKGKYIMNPQGYDWNTLKEQIDVLNEARSDFLSKQE